MVPASFTRNGFVVLDATGRPIGVLVHDSRDLHAGACRLCGGARSVDPDTGEIIDGAVYDRVSWSLTARWLGRHLGSAHGLDGLRVAAGSRLERRLVRLVAAANAVLATCEKAAAA